VADHWGDRLFDPEGDYYWINVRPVWRAVEHV
jgi:hypothetical protein